MGAHSNIPMIAGRKNGDKDPRVLGMEMGKAAQKPLSDVGTQAGIAPERHDFPERLRLLSTYSGISVATGSIPEVGTGRAMPSIVTMS